MLKFLDNFEEYVLLVLFPAMVVVVFVATVARYLDLFPMFWGEELARYIMVYLAYTGAGLGMKRGAHISVSFLVDRIKSPRVRLGFDILRLSIILLFTVTIIVLMTRLMQELVGMQQTSPALYIPIWTVYLGVPYGMVLVSIRAVQAFVIQIRDMKRRNEDADPDGELSTNERK